MALVIYAAIASLDGYVEDAQGRFGWAAPDEEVHGFVNELERPIGTYLYGRRMYETMLPWETMDADSAHPDQLAVPREFAELWRAADKIVYSRTLTAVSSARTRLERDLDVDAVRALTDGSATDVSIGGAELAGQAIRAGVVDEIRLLLVPAIVGGGKRALPDGASARLRLVTERRFRSGVVHLQYRLGD
jgi:dihydrofolate reductase